MGRPAKHATEEDRLEARRASFRRYAAKKRAADPYSGWSEERERERIEDACRRLKTAREDPVKGEVMRAASRQYYRDNREKVAAKDAARNAQPATQERRRQLQRARYAEKLKDDPAYVESRNARLRAHYEANPEYYTAKGSESARRKARTFGSLSPEHKEQLIAFYVESKRLTAETGVEHEVDHIEPLRGKLSCGLHVSWNLQILTKQKNREKGNRLGY